MIEVKVSGATPVETAQQLKEFAGLINLPKVGSKKEAISEDKIREPYERKTTTKSTKNTKPDVEDDDQEITIEDIKKKAVQLKKEQGNDAVKAILQKFDLERASAVEEEDYDEFYAALEEALDA